MGLPSVTLLGYEDDDVPTFGEGVSVGLGVPELGLLCISLLITRTALFVGIAHSMSQKVPTNLTPNTSSSFLQAPPPIPYMPVPKL